MAPITVAYVAGGGCEFRQEAKNAPLFIGVAAETNLIAVAAQASPAVVDDRTLGIFALGYALTHLVVEESVIEPESVAQIVGVAAESPLLPVKPPEIDALLLKRMYYGVEVGVSPVHLTYTEWDRGLFALAAAALVRAGELPAFLAIDIVLRAVIVGGAGSVVGHESLIAVLVRLYSRCRMEVQGCLVAQVVYLAQELLRIREELFLPAVAGPAYPLSELVLRRILGHKGKGLVPVHVYHHHVDRNVVGAYFPGQIDELEIRILPIAAPPVAEHIFRRKRNAAGYFRKVGERRLVVVSVCEYVKVLPVCAVAAGNPVVPVGIHGLEEMSRALVHYRPAVA